jgi:hypothetical protein
MPDNRSVSSRGDIVGSMIVTGDMNKIEASVTGNLTRVTLPPGNSVNIQEQLAGIRAILQQMGGEHAAKIGRALDDADEEAQKPRPNKEEIGSGLERALDYANKGGDFAEHVEKLAPYVLSAVAWLGTNWHTLLPFVGLTV